MKKLVLFLVGSSIAIVLLCCGGVILIGVFSESPTPEERARYAQEVAELKAKQEERAREKANQDRIHAEESARHAKAAAENRAREDRDSEDRSAANDEREGAIFAGKEFAKRGLEHPSTASFPWTPPNARKSSDGTWLVSGTVKAKNSFNLETTLRYMCRVRRDDSDWTLVDRQISESAQ